MPQDLTVSEILVDPLIRLVMQADRVSVHSFAKLLDEAAHRQSPRSARETALPLFDAQRAQAPGHLA